VVVYHSFFNTDNAAITRKAIPAHHMLLVKNQTTTATIMAGMRIKTRRIMKIIISPRTIKPINPKTS